METVQQKAKREIKESLKLSASCMRLIGLSLTKPNTRLENFRQKLTFVATVIGVGTHVFSEVAFLCVTSANSPRVEDVVPLIHTVGYGILSVSKFLVLCFKRNVFAQLLEELTSIWPVSPVDNEARSVKEKSLKALRFMHNWYFGLNVSGVWFYIITPIVLYFYYHSRGQVYEIRTVWKSWYPFNVLRERWLHVTMYIFEVISGQSCVWVMICSDLLFSGMASHIVLLLKLLQNRLRALGDTTKTDEENYQEIISCIKLHQRLIRYCNDLEDAFSLVNLINILLSSVNICCVVFVIVLLEPLMGMSNKLFFGAALIQIGVICWYGEDIIHAVRIIHWLTNANVAKAVYNSKWYELSPRCRRNLAFLIQRSQKQIAFTALNFTNISLVTYSAILTRSYSYFTLLYTMYKEN